MPSTGEGLSTEIVVRETLHCPLPFQIAGRLLMQGALNAGKSITCHGISFVTEGENSTYYG
jgi:hypothetical protein